MSVFRITGQRPDRGSAVSTGAAMRSAVATSRPKRPVNCARKFPVPCEQRVFSRKSRVLASWISSTEKPWAPASSTVALRRFG